MISFALAMVAIIHTKNLEKGGGYEADVLENLGIWFIWALQPVVVTMGAYRLSVCLQSFLESCSKAFAKVDRLTVDCIREKALAGFSETIKHAKQTLLEQWSFYATLCVWLVCGVLSWTLFLFSYWAPVAFYFAYDNGSFRLEFTRNIVLFAGSITVGVAGLAMKGTVVLRNGRPVSIQEPLRSSETNTVKGAYGCWDKSHVPFLLLGWGIGYWVSSLMFNLIFAWNLDDWDNAPIAVKVISCVVVPLFVLASFFMMADSNFLGVKFGGVIQPAVELMQDRRGVVHWTMVTVLRDFSIYWAAVAYFLATLYT